nr:MAG TPA: hypothetical protein [Caudoviricetes sp.]
MEKRMKRVTENTPSSHRFCPLHLGKQSKTVSFSSIHLPWSYCIVSQ